MKNAKKNTESESVTLRPALSLDARESRLISLAMDRAEEQLTDGTASSQLIVHYLKLGTTKERIEKEILEKQKVLIDAKTESIQSAKRAEELYEKALASMREYGGLSKKEEDDWHDDY